jgi:hypothetical protein
MKFCRVALIVALGVSSAGALASSTNCSDVYDLIKQGSYTLSTAQKEYPECFAGSSPAATQQISATSFQQVSAISAGLGSRMLGGGGSGPQKQAATASPAWRRRCARQMERLGQRVAEQQPL